MSNKCSSKETSYRVMYIRRWSTSKVPWPTSCWVRKTKLNITWVKWWDTYTFNNREKRGTASNIQPTTKEEKQGALYFKRLMMVDLSWKCFLTFSFSFALCCIVEDGMENILLILYTTFYSQHWLLYSFLQMWWLCSVVLLFFNMFWLWFWIRKKDSFLLSYCVEI